MRSFIQTKETVLSPNLDFKLKVHGDMLVLFVFWFIYIFAYTEMFPSHSRHCFATI